MDEGTPERIGTSRLPPLRGNCHIAGPRVLRKWKENSSPASPTPTLLLKAASRRTPWGLSGPKPLGIPCQSTLERSCWEHAGGGPAACNHPHLVATGVGEGREAWSRLWPPLLDALIPHKAGGGLQSSPQQAPGSQDHQGFFLSDNQSGEQNQPPPESAPPWPESPAQPPGPWQVLPILPLLGETSPGSALEAPAPLPRVLGA